MTNKSVSIVAIRIFFNENSEHPNNPMADLAFMDGTTVTIDWADTKQREAYEKGINAYTLFYDERKKCRFGQWVAFAKDGFSYERTDVLRWNLYGTKVGEAHKTLLGTLHGGLFGGKFHEALPKEVLHDSAAGDYVGKMHSVVYNATAAEPDKNYNEEELRLYNEAVGDFEKVNFWSQKLC